jgi:hypothetical protein
VEDWSFESYYTLNYLVYHPKLMRCWYISGIKFLIKSGKSG